MLAAFTKLKNAQKVKEFLLKRNLIDLDHLPAKELGFIYFPLRKKAVIPDAEVVDTEFRFFLKDKQPNLEELLRGKLTARQLRSIPRSQEIVGTIMILEVPESLAHQEKIIAQAYLKMNRHVTTVVKKDQIHSGIFRLRKVKILAGKKTKETIHHENGLKMKIDLEKTYFSARSANERLRIAKQINAPEQVLVMFSGAAPYPLVLARNSSAEMVYGIEINPLAHQLALENVALNSLGKKIKIFPGDVYDLLPKLRKRFDRIVMPLPKTGEEFLPVALKKAKPGAIIHLYSFLEESGIKEYSKKIKKICAENKKEARILRTVKCGQFSPHIFRICFDLRIR